MCGFWCQDVSMHVLRPCHVKREASVHADHLLVGPCLQDSYAVCIEMEETVPYLGGTQPAGWCPLAFSRIVTGTADVLADNLLSHGSCVWTACNHDHHPNRLISDQVLKKCQNVIPSVTASLSDRATKMLLASSYGLWEQWSVRRFIFSFVLFDVSKGLNVPQFPCCPYIYYWIQTKRCKVLSIIDNV